MNISCRIRIGISSFAKWEWLQTKWIYGLQTVDFKSSLHDILVYIKDFSLVEHFLSNSDWLKNSCWERFQTKWILWTGNCGFVTYDMPHCIRLHWWALCSRNVGQTHRAYHSILESWLRKTTPFFGWYNGRKEEIEDESLGELRVRGKFHSTRIIYVYVPTK